MKKLVSKKLLVVLLLIGLEVAKSFGLALDPSSIQNIVYIAISYLSGQSMVDIVKAYKK
tara:strand:- start:854 stop:1030 length:177 start_codon:yes stop_codon:yes gene_type:complete